MHCYLSARRWQLNKFLVRVVGEFSAVPRDAVVRILRSRADYTLINDINTLISSLHADTDV